MVACEGDKSSTPRPYAQFEGVEDDRLPAVGILVVKRDDERWQRTALQLKHHTTDKGQVILVMNFEFDEVRRNWPEVVHLGRSMNQGG